MNLDHSRSSRALSGTAVMAIAIVLGATACSSSSGSGGAIASCKLPSGLSTLVHYADAAVIGTVTSESIARLGSDSDHPFLSEYRTATLDVEQALWSSEDLPVEPGKQVTVTLLGNGRHEGDEYPCDGVSTRWNDMEGPLTEGRRVLLLLDARELWPGMKGRNAGALGNFIVGHSKGNWTIQGARAVNVVPERSAPLDALVARLIEAHDAPVDYESRRGAMDPLEATEPAPPPTEPTMPRMPGAEEPTETPEGGSSPAPTD